MTGFDAHAFFAAEWDEHLAAAQATRTGLGDAFVAMLAAWAAAARAGGTIFFFGNGGSAADAQHLATELTVRYARDRRALAAVALTTDSSALTAIGNDLGFERLFARQIEALGRKGDVAVGISTSGRSPNVLAGLKEARARGMVTCALGGGDGGALPQTADHLLIVPSRTTARIQEMHIALGQMLCAGLERALGLAE